MSSIFCASSPVSKNTSAQARSVWLPAGKFQPELPADADNDTITLPEKFSVSCSTVRGMQTQNLHRENHCCFAIAK